MRARTRKCAPAETRMRALRPIRETRSSSLSLADVRRSCRYASGADVAALRTGAMQSSQATHADELADRQTASTRRAARRSEHFAEISAGSGEDDKLIGTLRLCAARAQKEAASAPLAMLHDRLDRSAEAKARRALLLEGGRAEQWARAQAILSKTHLADAGRLKALRMRQRAAVHTIRTAAVAAKRPRVGEAEVDARLVRSLAVPTAIGLEASPLQLQATGQEASAARQDALGETSTAYGGRRDRSEGIHATHTAACDISAERSSAAGGLSKRPAARSFYQCTSANSVAAHAARR